MTDGNADDNEEDQRPGMRTRKKNQLAHPGAIAMQGTTKRRSSAQVKADNEKKAKAKAEAAADMEERVAKVARIEEEMAEKQKVSKFKQVFILFSLNYLHFLYGLRRSRATAVVGVARGVSQQAKQKLELLESRVLNEAKLKALKTSTRQKFEDRRKALFRPGTTIPT